MKKVTYIVGLVFVAAILFSSCRTQKKACAAYSKADLPQTEQTPS